ncbi:MAG TPA: NYN domain-containing protein [Acidimicrobiales bacterium]|nr:NYN domain-containing protein [Acidimicrobiales bacterium]
MTAYIDGFNLYHGLRAKHERRYLWLDLQALCESLLLEGQRLTAVRYFTAPLRRQPDRMARQQTYWNALGAHATCLTIELGRFQETMTMCRLCGGRTKSYEEKETDVAIAAALVEDAADQAFDTALLVSADSDLCPAVRAIRRLHPAAKVVAAFPPARRSDELRKVVDASFTIAERKLRSARLPDHVQDQVGHVFSRPKVWR